MSLSSSLGGRISQILVVNSTQPQLHFRVYYSHVDNVYIVIKEITHLDKLNILLKKIVRTSTL